MYCYTHCLVFVSLYTYSNSIYVFEVLCRILDIAIDSLINIEANFVFIVFQREICAYRIVCLEALIVIL